MKRVIGIGELLWDVLPEGKQLGGAPCNFVYHAQKQGAEGYVLSAVGDDKYGGEILEVLKSKSISPDLVQVNDKPTSTVDVILNEQGIPEYTIHENVAWDFICYNETIERKLSETDMVCFGTLAQRNVISRNAIEKILDTCHPDTLRVYDVNLRQHYFSQPIVENSLMLCNVLKVNEEELPVICGMVGIKSGDEEERAVHLMRRYDLKLVALTKGINGSLLVTPKDRSFLPTPGVDVRDTVGAGDAFTAAMAVGYANNVSLKNLHQQAVEISAYVCTREGAMPEYNL
ncbi:MAG: carbohydrate kinase [Bacteroidales bacterium]